MNFNLLDIIVIVCFTALIVTVLFRQLRLPVVIGYLVVGALLGPHVLGVVPELPEISQLAEFGIVFLMFTVGLEFSLSKLIALRNAVFFIGGFQVLFTILITTVVATALGIEPSVALAVGSIVAMSSTAIVMKQLNEQLELHTPHGLNAIGILLFQDLAVIPIIILIASLAPASAHSFYQILAWALLKGILALFIIFVIGHWLLKPFFSMIAKTRALELFTLSVLVVTLIGAWLTNSFGLSYALGAFLAGIMLAETEFRHQIEVEIRPFRDLLLGLFFITIGMVADVENWYSYSQWIFLLLLALVPGKLLLIYVISRLFGHSINTSFRTGLVLAQGSEFGFAILTLALSNKIIPNEYGQVILAALLISLAISPLLITFNKQIAEYIFRRSLKPSEAKAKKKLEDAAHTLNQHVILCGYGRVGQHLARMLSKIDFPYIALDLDPELVERASLAGDNVMYGDPSHPDILKKAGINQAKVVVLSFNDVTTATKVIGIIKENNPQIPVLVRCRNEIELKQLRQSGASQVIAELFEESLTLSHHLFYLIQIPETKISKLIQEVRNKDYDLLYKVFTGDNVKDTEDLNTPMRDEIMPVIISAGDYAVGHTIKELGLKRMGIEVIRIRRGLKQIKPHANTKIHSKDIVILYGSETTLEDAERRLLEG